MKSPCSPLSAAAGWNNPRSPEHDSLSKIALFTLLSGAVFAAQAAAPHAGMAMHEQHAAAQAQSISGKGVIKAIDMDNKKSLSPTRPSRR